MNNQEIIEIFFSRSYEELINEKILDDKMYVIPIDNLKEYVNNILSVPYSDFLYALIDRSFDKLKSSDFTQCSSLSACEIEMCENLIRENNPGFDFLDIGMLFPHYCKSDTPGALRKYGENQIKTAKQLGLTYEYYGLWYLEAIGYVYPSLSLEERNSFLSRTILRDSLYGRIMRDLLEHDVYLLDYLTDLKTSTIIRRSPGIKKILNIAISEARRNNITLCECHYTKPEQIGIDESNHQNISNSEILYSQTNKFTNHTNSILTAADASETYKVNIKGIKLEIYSGKSVAVYGDTRKFKEILKELGGRFNPYLKGGPGWIFPKRKLEMLENYFSSHNAITSEYFIKNEKNKESLENPKIAESKWIDLLTNMNCAHKDGLIAPHKAIFVLSIIHGIQSGNITDNKIYPTEYLINEFKKCWRKYVPSGSSFRVNFYSPYIHLQNEKFYKVVPNDYSTNIENTDTWTKGLVIKKIRYGILDEELFQLFTLESFREKAIYFLVKKYLSNNVGETNIKSKAKSNLTDSTAKSFIAGNVEPIKIDKYIGYFDRLKIVDTLGIKGPHKAILLIAIFECFKTGTFKTATIPFNSELELKYSEMWTKYMQCPLSLGMGYPFIQLGEEPFFTLETKRDIKTIDQVWNKHNVLRHVKYGRIASDLFKLMSDRKNISKLEEYLIKRYCSGAELKDFNDLSIDKSQMNGDEESCLLKKPETNIMGFQKYLRTIKNKKGENYTESSVKTYSSALISSYLAKKVLKYDPSGDFYQIIDIETIDTLWYEVGYDCATKGKSSLYKTALDLYRQYILFVSDKTPSKEIDTNEDVYLQIVDNEKKEARKDEKLQSDSNLKLDSNCKIFFINTIGCRAKGRLVENGKVVILKGSILRNEVTNTYGRKKIRDEILSKYCSKTSEGFVCDSDLPAMSPSGASGLVQGRSSNGKLDWKDSNGIILAKYL